MLRAVILCVICSGVKQANAQFGFNPGTPTGYTYSPGFFEDHDEHEKFYFSALRTPFPMQILNSEGEAYSYSDFISHEDWFDFFEPNGASLKVPKYDNLEITPPYGYEDDFAGATVDGFGLFYAGWYDLATNLDDITSTSWEEYMTLPAGMQLEYLGALRQDFAGYGFDTYVLQAFALTSGPAYEPACKDWCSVSTCPGPNTPDFFAENCNACDVCAQSAADQICEEWCNPHTCYPNGHELNTRCAGCSFCAACADKQDQKKEKKCKKIAKKGKCSKPNKASQCEFTCCNA